MGCWKASESADRDFQTASFFKSSDKGKRNIYADCYY